MVAAEETPIARVKVADDLSFADLGRALKAGFSDFLACPVYGLFFAGIYVAAGIFLYVAAVEWGEPMWLVPAVAGFPLVAPFL